MAKFRQLSTQLWMDDKFLSLSMEARLLFVWMFTHPESGSSGLFTLNRNVCETQTGIKNIDKTIKELEDIERVRCDYKHHLIWVVNQFKHASKSPKIVIGVFFEIQRLPVSFLIDEFVSKYELEFIPYSVSDQTEARKAQ